MAAALSYFSDKRAACGTRTPRRFPLPKMLGGWYPGKADYCLSWNKQRRLTNKVRQITINLLKFIVIHCFSRLSSLGFPTPEHMIAVSFDAGALMK
jgi:hypothetical protein